MGLERGTERKRVSERGCKRKRLQILALGRNALLDPDIRCAFFIIFFMYDFFFLLCFCPTLRAPLAVRIIRLYECRVLIFKLNSTTVFSENSGIIQLHQFVRCYRTADKSSAVFPFISLKHRHQSCSSPLSRTYVHTKTTPGALLRMSRQNLRNGIIMSLFSRLDGQQY